VIRAVCRRAWPLVLGLALVGAPPVADAQRLGRLFTSAEERASLDELRYQAQFATPAPEPEPAAAAPGEPQQPAPQISSFTINGIVRSSRGRGTVWVNGDQIERGGVTREGIQVQTTGAGGRSVQARLPSGADTIELKPGQKIDVVHGVVLESYERGEQTPAGPSAFQPESGTLDLSPRVQQPTRFDAAPDLPALAPGAATAPGATGAQRDAALAAVLRQALDSLPPAYAMTPEQRAQAEALRRQLEQTGAGASTAKP